MLILEIGSEFLKATNDENGENKTFKLDKDIINDGNILNIPVVFNLVKDFVKINQGEISFIINTSEIISKEVSYPDSIKSKSKKFVYTWEVIEKNRVILYSIPKSYIDACYMLANKLEMRVKFIDYADNILMVQIKKMLIKGSYLLINIKEKVTVISVFKDNVVKIQNTFENGSTENLITSASRIIKYYSDKNNKERIKEIYVNSLNVNQYNLAQELSVKMNIQVSNIENDINKYKYIGKGTLDFAKNIEIKDKGISQYFSVYRIVVIIMVGAFLFFMAPVTLEYIYTISEKKEIQGEFDAIDDIVEIIYQEKSAKAKMEAAQIYDAILKTLPKNVSDIVVEFNQETILITGNYITQIDENDIKVVYSNSVLTTNINNNTFKIVCRLEGEKD